MKKENKMKKREEERKELIKQREKRFQKQGNICMAVIVGGAALMFLVAVKLGGSVLGKNLIIGLAVIVGLAFVWSVVNASIRIREMRQERDED